MQDLAAVGIESVPCGTSLRVLEAMGEGFVVYEFCGDVAWSGCRHLLARFNNELRNG